MLEQESEGRVIVGEIKFCKDCKYFSPAPEWGSGFFRYYETALCAATHDRVSGNPEWTCYRQRDMSAQWFCGPEAKYFEPKEKSE